MERKKAKSWQWQVLHLLGRTPVVERSIETEVFSIHLFEERFKANWWQEDKSSKVPTSAPGKQLSCLHLGESVGGTDSLSAPKWESCFNLNQFSFPAGSVARWVPRQIQTSGGLCWIWAVGHPLQHLVSYNGQSGVSGKPTQCGTKVALSPHCCLPLIFWEFIILLYFYPTFPPGNWRCHTRFSLPSPCDPHQWPYEVG